MKNHARVGSLPRRTEASILTSVQIQSARSRKWQAVENRNKKKNWCRGPGLHRSHPAIVAIVSRVTPGFLLCTSLLGPTEGEPHDWQPDVGTGGIRPDSLIRRSVGMGVSRRRV